MRSLGWAWVIAAVVLAAVALYQVVSAAELRARCDVLLRERERIDVRGRELEGRRSVSRADFSAITRRSR